MASTSRDSTRHSGLDFARTGPIGIRARGSRGCLGWWFDTGVETESAPPPLPAWSAVGSGPGGPPARLAGRPAISWPSTTATSEVPCRFELFGGGSDPGWGRTGATPRPARPTSRPRPRDWIIELRGRPGRMVLSRRARLGSPDPPCSCAGGAWRCCRSWSRAAVRVERRARRALSLPPAIAAAPLEDSRALLLTESKRRGSARSCRSACPAFRIPPIAGGSRSKATELALNQTPAGRRCWLPLLVSWDPSAIARACTGAS